MDNSAVGQGVLINCDYNTLRNWLIDYVENVWSIPQAFKDGQCDDINFEQLGMDSLEAHMMASLIEDDFGVEFDPNILLEHPTVNQLARYCCKSQDEL